MRAKQEPLWGFLGMGITLENILKANFEKLSKLKNVFISFFLL